jgi:signal transduction histidine kinase
VSAPGRARARVRLSPQFTHAARVALTATLLVAIVVVGCVAILDRVVSGRLTNEVDYRLTETLADARAQRLTARAGTPQPGGDQSEDADHDMDEVPVYLWQVTPGHHTVRLTAGAPALSPGQVPAPGHPATVRLGTSTFRVAAQRGAGGWLVAGQSLAQQRRTEDMLLDGAGLVAPVLLLAMFAGSLVIGLRALAPVEQARRRQLEFTADASHELRTPLSVIGAELGIALSSPRPAGDYRATLVRIEGESHRLRRIVEDLLWLARFDSQPPPPGAEPVDLCTIAGECADRFQAIAHAQSPGISVTAACPATAWISAPPEWIDRLAGVLTDNACRHAGPGGSVRLSVTSRGNRVSLTVEDSGPGIPPADRARLFDRFHRATGAGGGAGLGLAIADSIAGSTGGHWRIGESGLGGALFEVSWRRSAARPAAGPAAPGPSGQGVSP